LPSIRLGEAADFPEVLVILRELGLESEGLEPGMPNLLVAELDGYLVGCAALESDGSYGLMRAVGVTEQAHGRAIGAQLVHGIHEIAKELGLRAVFLLTTTAAEYFCRFGYEIDHGPPAVVTTSSEYAVCSTRQAILMRKNIT
jgi:amino-acid N-acetyltransferase